MDSNTAMGVAFALIVALVAWCQLIATDIALRDELARVDPFEWYANCSTACWKGVCNCPNKVQQ